MTVFTSFYVERPGKPSGLEEYLEYIKLGQAALACTNPRAVYTVLTDPQTLPLLQPHCSAIPTAPKEGPLMLKYLVAQAAFLKFWPGDDLIVLAATDCVANRPLNSATHSSMGFATTYNKSGKVNNVAYVRDKELGHWLLCRAIQLLATSPALVDKHEWLGDQEAWEAAIGPWEPGNNTIREAHPDGKRVILFPCGTHNRFVRKNGSVKQGDENAFILHFKGDRKQHMRQYVFDNILGRNDHGPSWLRSGYSGQTTEGQAGG